VICSLKPLKILKEGRRKEDSDSCNKGILTLTSGQKKQDEENKNQKSKDNTSEGRNAKNADVIIDGTPALDQFYSDEEPENFESQKEDMKIYLNKLNKRIDILVDAWKKAENMMSKMGDYKVLMD